MKVWFLFVIALSTFATAQTPAGIPPATLNFENGVIANGMYSNECLGFSLSVPAGWKTDESVVAGGKARRRSDKSLVLLFLRKEGDTVGRIILSASLAGDQTTNAQDFVSSAVREQLKASSDRELIRDAFAVGYGGQHFFRADYKSLLGGKQPLYFAYLYTKFRGYIIGETIVSASPQALDEAANSLQAISFREDQVNPKCLMAPDESASKQGAQRVRVSSGVATGLLVKKVNPQYPEDARHARIQGQVVMKVLISKSGDVESVDLISGDPALTPGAMEAVKHWKYRPYMIDGVPVELETQVTVSFTLSGF